MTLSGVIDTKALFSSVGKEARKACASSSLKLYLSVNHYSPSVRILLRHADTNSGITCQVSVFRAVYGYRHIYLSVLV
jgi:hypothetical protein